MTIRTRIFGCAAAAALIAACAPAHATDLDQIFAPWNSADTPGCAIGIQDGARRTLAAFGSADLEHRVPSRPASVYEAGSVSKQFTAAAVLLLAQDGKIGLDDDIRTYLPEMPDFGTKITIDHLLTHTSGLRDWGTLATMEGWPRGTRAMTHADVLAMMARQTGLNYRPGAEYSYTNTGYVLLAIIVERVSGQSFSEFSSMRIFRPLRLTSTSWRDDFRRIVKDRAIAYVKRGAAYEQQMPFENVVGSGGLLTTVEDLLTWNQALDDQRLGAFVARELERPGVLTDGRRIRYAHGLRVTSRRGVREVSHDGATAGYRTWLARFPERKLSIAVLCNAADVGRSAAVIGYRIADQILPPESSPPQLGGEVRSAARAGQFVSESTGLPLVLVMDNGALRKQGGEKLQAAGANTLRAEDGLLRFESNDRFLLEDADGNRIAYNRKMPVAPDRAALSAFAGSYRSGELDVIYTVEERDGRLIMRNNRRQTITMRLDPAYADAFLYESGTGLARFQRDAGGRVTELRVGLSNRARDVQFVRVGAAAIAARN